PVPLPQWFSAAHRPASALYSSTISCGILPRSEIGLPLRLAQDRIALFCSRSAAALPRARAAARPPTTTPPRPTRRLWEMKSEKALRSLVAFFSERSISYWTPSSAYFTVSSALPPSRSSSRTTISRRATVQIPFTQSARYRYQETITRATATASIDRQVCRVILSARYFGLLG